ncbi:SIS domain-containing protein, partial [Desulfocucumis palustris]|uniref:SIS domain-containing protein n=1 Tax=Desulfocucumis palustris TaxID=1898651 RepID=UPI000F0B46D7
LKEISYIHAEAYAAGELKHGTLALIVKDVPVIALAMEGIKEVEKVVDHVMHIPTTHPVLAPILSVVPLQLLAYRMAVARGSDLDQPRNLAKSVTVE